MGGASIAPVLGLLVGLAPGLDRGRLEDVLKFLTVTIVWVRLMCYTTGSLDA